MKNAKHDNNQKFPKLGQWLTWVDKPGSVNKILIWLGLVCFILLCFDFLYPKHGHFDVENIRGFYSLYGFIAFTAVVFLAMFLRTIIIRKPDYYSLKDVNSEKYQTDDLGQVDQDD